MYQLRVCLSVICDAELVTLCLGDATRACHVTVYSGCVVARCGSDWRGLVESDVMGFVLLCGAVSWLKAWRIYQDLCCLLFELCTIEVWRFVRRISSVAAKHCQFAAASSRFGLHDVM